ncbi:S-adenosylmethionine-dependent methyltransferase [Nitzschia inconspicua]|uniref:S-adenosylmethionine-dependent methyltransferase n=1 Tax=Nitzschia inconspicua TaxID=303405 RepID=A0A9K3Q3D5_9STRA|nr:S-adenosylmethionine-dependent methyltransferase [Nitzschia inconspicua]
MKLLQSLFIATVASHAYLDHGTTSAFLLPSTIHSLSTTLSKQVLPRICLRVQQRENENPTTQTYKKKRKDITLADLKNELLKNPAALNNSNKEPFKKKRTRRRTENPQQKYVYAAQRKTKSQMEDGSDDILKADEGSVALQNANRFLAEARRMGLTNPASQHCDPLMDGKEPEIVGQIRVGEEETGSGAFAYVIYKPQGWSILGSSGVRGGGSASSGSSTSDTDTNNSSDNPTSSSKEDITKTRSRIRRVKIRDSKGKEEFLEFDEADVLALLSVEERLEIEASGGSVFDQKGPIMDDEDFRNSISSWNVIENMSAEEREDAGIEDEDYDPTDIPDFDEAAVLALLSPEELIEYNSEKKTLENENNLCENPANALERYENLSEDDLDPAVVENLKRIKARMNKKSNTSSFSSVPRPSVVAWLKEKKMQEGTPIRGGNFWTALAGASDVDDTGLVLLVPKENSKNVFVDFTEYIAVVGNGNCIDPKAKSEVPKEVINIDLISKLKRNREGDVAQAVRFSVSEHPSTCTSIISHAQSQFDDGIRGDPGGNPFDRRAPRRLIHCSSIAISSLLFDETVQSETELPDDIAVLTDRLNNHKFRRGSFLGRQALQENPFTNAYREINGAADGFPGWTVDRYSDWLLVQHDEKEYRGPLPSIHDGCTAGVYLLPSNPNRGAMGSKENIRPFLLEGKPAPETVEIMENGIKYHVNLNRDLSTGIFLDQRPHRAWLSQNCNSDTHILNCFAHCGAFTVAAATAGASTVSLDLNKKWLDRIQPQLEANGIEFDERHDCIYGDCFDWLEKLEKRGEKFDVVILDPPSSSVGKKKRRWSVKNDMDELVQLAAPLVKKGGLLWTTTNSASISPIKFANQCHKGLENAGIKSAMLERIQPMAVDFPSIGPQPVKNLVWRLN